MPLMLTVKKTIKTMINFEQKTITPQMAKEMLAYNNGNRQLNLSVVEKYARDINAGLWKDNTGEVIKIAKSGRILDGQHRLHAIIKSDTALTLFLATGLEEDIFTVLDTGATRGSKDTLFIAGVSNSTVLPSLIQSWWNVKNKRIRQRNYFLRNQEILDIYNENSEMWQDIVRKSKNYYNYFSKTLNRSIIGALYKSFGDVAGYDVADDFFNQLCIGKEFSNESIFLLRKKLLEDRIKNVKIPNSTKYTLIIKTWNAYRKGIQWKKLYITTEIENII